MADDITSAINSKSDDCSVAPTQCSAATTNNKEQQQPISLPAWENWTEEKLAEKEKRAEQMDRWTEDKPADILWVFQFHSSVVRIYL